MNISASFTSRQQTWCKGTIIRFRWQAIPRYCPALFKVHLLALKLRAGSCLGPFPLKGHEGTAWHKFRCLGFFFWERRDICSPFFGGLVWLL